MSKNQKAAIVICTWISIGFLVVAYVMPEGLLTEVSLQLGVFIFFMLAFIGQEDEERFNTLLSSLPFWIGVFLWVFGYPYGQFLLIVGIILSAVWVLYRKFYLTTS